MLRKLRIRLGAPVQPLRPFRPGPTVVGRRWRTAVAVKEEELNVTDGYGTDYGAGPSRIPYQARNRSSVSKTQPSAVTLLETYDVAAQQVRVAHSPASSARSAQHIRNRLPQLSPGSFADPTRILQAIDGTSVDETRPIWSLSRLELHTIIHFLLRTSRGHVAIRIISEVINHGISRRPKRRRMIAGKTLVRLFTLSKDKYISFPANFFLPPSQTWRYSSQRRSKAQSQKRTPGKPSRELQSLLSLLESLQDVRHRRPESLYESIIHRCIAEKLPDVAAKVYVGLVEEWVTEGRVAEHGELDETPGEQGEEPLEDSGTDLVALYWKDVRTWKFPGEVLSPHDRLDLWHPRHLSLGEKMRSFPYPLPSSPPTVVPSPNHHLMAQIIASLSLDPATSTPEAYTSSLRALAYLSNTILSRTLPIPSLASLLRAMESTKHVPAVYPESIDIETIPRSQRWAYECFTQIHLALQSLAFSPPISGRSLRYIKDVEDAHRSGIEPPPPPTTSPYMLRPLSFRACTVLLRYAISRLKLPTALGRLVSYMRDGFGTTHSNPRAHNVILEGATASRDKKLATTVIRSLFGVDLEDESKPEISNKPNSTDSVSRAELPPVISTPSLQPKADVSSLATFMIHLITTSQFDHFEKLIYQLIPFLSYSKSNNTTSLTPDYPDVDKDDVDGVSRPRPEPLTPRLYSVILSGLGKSGKTGLAQRVYNLAIQAEQDWLNEHIEKHQSNPNPYHRTEIPPVPLSQRLSKDLFTNMLLVWEKELRNGEGEWPIGWRLPEGQGMVKRDVGAGLMAWRTYLEARKRWIAFRKERERELLSLGRATAGQNVTFPTLAALDSGSGRHPMEPDERFFRAAVRACRKRWDLESLTNDDPTTQPSRQGSPELTIGQRRELQLLATDMEEWGIEVPPGIKRVLGYSEAGAEAERNGQDGSEGLKDQPDWGVKLKQSLRQEDPAARLGQKYWRGMQEEDERLRLGGGGGNGTGETQRDAGSGGALGGL